MKHGCDVQEAATLFRAFEITGDSTFLEDGIKYCEFLIRAQKVTGRRKDLMNLINGRVIGEKEYLDQRIAAARRVLTAQKSPEKNEGWQVPEDGIVRKEDAYPGLQFIFDVFLGEGKISPEFLYQMNRGFLYPHFHEKWDIAGDWTRQSPAIEDWVHLR